MSEGIPLARWCIVCTSRESWGGEEKFYNKLIAQTPYALGGSFLPDLVLESLNRQERGSFEATGCGDQ